MIFIEETEIAVAVQDLARKPIRHRIKTAGGMLHIGRTPQQRSHRLKLGGLRQITLNPVRSTSIKPEHAPSPPVPPVPWPGCGATLAAKHINPNPLLRPPIQVRRTVITRVRVV